MVDLPQACQGAIDVIVELAGGRVT